MSATEKDMLEFFASKNENVFVLITICCALFFIFWMMFLIVSIKKNRRLKMLQIKDVENEAWRRLKEDELTAQKEAFAELACENRELVKENERLKADCLLREKYMAEKLSFVEKSKEEMSLKFKDISNEIIKAQNTAFGQNQKTALDLMLKPFEGKLAELKKKMEESHDDRIKFDAQIKSLFDLNQSLSKEATNLSNALKGNKKIQGNWGEFQLERILEISGLEKGINYFEQETFRGADNEMLRPDVIIRLPDERQVIVDSKVSLNDYVAYVNAEDEAAQSEALKRHINAIKKHIDELSSKEYQKLLKDQTLDYVMMFIPIESAYVEAVRADLSLYDYAVKKNIAITTPSSLLPLLRTVENLWQIEKRNKSAAELAEIGGKIYDKLAGFVKDMEQIDRSLRATHTHYENAMTKLSGRGGAISFAHQLKDKGAKTSKNIELKTENNVLIEFDERVSNE